MSIALDNYTKTQQRALQDVRSICASLREKNSNLREENETLKMSIGKSDPRSIGRPGTGLTMDQRLRVRQT